MIKKELVANIARKTGRRREDVQMIVETLFDEVKETMVKGENIYLRGFGSFVTKRRASKIARNIKENCGFRVPPHKIAVFKPCKEFARKVRPCENVTR